MHRSPRVILVWLFAFIVAIATVRVVWTDLGTLHRRARSLGPDVSVVVAARDLPIGSTIAARDLRVVVRPSSTVATDALHETRAAIGHIVGADVLRDDVLRTRHLTSAEHPGIDGVVPAGRRAVRVATKDGLRPPLGAIVDVLAAFDPTAVAVGGAGERALVVASGARVLGTDPGIDSGTSGSTQTEFDGTTGGGVTLLVTEAEARAVAFAAANGELSLALDPPENACCTSSSR
jgi:Flp pilus assembly protein CpaB